MAVSVTYEVITDESATDGDTADNGYVHPETEARRSFATGNRRLRDRNIRMAQAGKFHWTLREALRFIDAQCCESFEGQVDDHMTVRAMGEYHASQYEQLQVNYALHIDGVSSGTLDRLARVFEGKGVRFH